MPAYDRNEANSIFMSGDAAFTVADPLWWGTFNDPAKVKVVGKVSAARFPLGRTARGLRRDDIRLGDSEVDLARAQGAGQEMLGAMMTTRKADEAVEGDRRAAADTQFWPRSRPRIPSWSS